MKTFILPYSHIAIDVETIDNGDGIIKRISTTDFDVLELFEIKLSEWALQKFEIGAFPLWIDCLIKDMSISLPSTNEKFQDMVKNGWADWCTENILIGNQLDHYQFGEDWMAHDMIDYYGKLRADGSLFQRRYDFSVADIEIRIKSEQHA